MQVTGQDEADGAARRARSRKLGILLALLAASFYVGFIVLQVLQAK